MEYWTKKLGLRKFGWKVVKIGKKTGFKRGLGKLGVKIFRKKGALDPKKFWKKVWKPF